MQWPTALGGDDAAVGGAAGCVFECFEAECASRLPPYQRQRQERSDKL